eukprot:gene15354-18758_t
MDGVGLARQLRAQRPGLPVVLISGFSNRPIAEGEFVQLRKPCAPVELLGCNAAGTRTATGRAGAPRPRPQVRLHRPLKGHAMSNDDIIDTLNDLIETSKDGEYGFHTSAEYVTDTALRQSFERRSEECRIAAGEQSARVAVVSNDELGEVGTEFNRMAQTIQDNQARELADTNLLRAKVDSLLEV